MLLDNVDQVEDGYLLFCISFKPRRHYSSSNHQHVPWADRKAVPNGKRFSVGSYPVGRRYFKERRICHVVIDFCVRIISASILCLCVKPRPLGVVADTDFRIG